MQCVTASKNRILHLVIVSPQKPSFRLQEPFRSEKGQKIKSATIYLGFTTEECQNTTGPLKPLKAFSMNVQSNRRNYRA